MTPSYWLAMDFKCLSLLFFFIVRYSLACHIHPPGNVHLRHLGENERGDPYRSNSLCYGAETTVNASNNTADEVSGLVTRISQTCAPREPSFRVVIVTASVVGLSTCTPTTTC